MPKKEEKLHIAICDYIRLQYPHVVFLSEASGVRVSKGLAAKLKRMRSAETHLDLYILQPKLVHGEQLYCGLVLELKAVPIYKKDGTLLKNEHLEDQQRMIDKLNSLGYKATFAVGFEQAKALIDEYLA
jgi:hypothetical protein